MMGTMMVSITLHRCSVKLPARGLMLQLPARVTIGLAELREGLVCWMCVALMHGASHLCEHLCGVKLVVMLVMITL